MKSRHITRILDSVKFKDLSAEQISGFNAHTLECPQCRAAFQAAQVASVLLRENSNVETYISMPFFQAKVLNAWREKQIAPKPIAVFWKWWQASAVLVVLMFLTVIGLIAATFVGIKNQNSVSRNINPETDLYSTERVILNQKQSPTLTTEQVFEVLDQK